MREQQKDVIEKQHNAALQMAAVWKANQERNQRLEDLRTKDERFRQEQRKRTEAHISVERAKELARQSHAQSALDDDILTYAAQSIAKTVDDTPNKCSADYSTPSHSYSSPASSCDGGGSSGGDSGGSCGGGGCD